MGETETDYELSTKEEVRWLQKKFKGKQIQSCHGLTNKLKNLNLDYAELKKSKSGESIA